MRLNILVLELLTLFELSLLLFDLLSSVEELVLTVDTWKEEEIKI